jgi:hypothetical protein
MLPEALRYQVLIPLLTGAAVQPQYFHTTNPIESVNGSIAGDCANAITSDGCKELTTTSVLFDGNIPPLTELDGNMWASQLLTLQLVTFLIAIQFDFTGTRGYSGVGGVEVVMFNCPEWGITVTRISLLSSESMLDTTIPDSSSCDSFVTISLHGTTNLPLLTLVFYSRSQHNWLHLAEVMFYHNVTTATTDTDMTPATTDTVTTYIATVAMITGFLGMSVPTPITSSTPTGTPDTSTPPFLIIIIGIFFVVLLVVYLLIALLVCYYVKRHKHNTIWHTATEEEKYAYLRTHRTTRSIISYFSPYS